MREIKVIKKAELPEPKPNETPEAKLRRHSKAMMRLLRDLFPDDFSEIAQMPNNGTSNKLT